MEIETKICPICESALTEYECIFLETCSFTQKQKGAWIPIEEDFLNTVPDLEQKKHIVTHESDEGLFMKIHLTQAIIETTRLENGHNIEETECCIYVCNDFSYHSFLLSDKKPPSGA